MYISVFKLLCPLWVLYKNSLVTPKDRLHVMLREIFSFFFSLNTEIVFLSSVKNKVRITERYKKG